MGRNEPWQPTAFRRFVKAAESSTKIVRIVTDAGEAYLKAMGPHVSPHKLACELVGTQLAQWFGLSVFEFATMTVKSDDEIPLKSGRSAMPGPAFVTRSHRGIEWSGSSRLLARLDNPDDISRLVVFDTWALNWDRHAPADMHRRPRPDNVFLSAEGASRGRFRLMAMDQSECFADGPELNARIGKIGRMNDDRIFGLFPVFVKRMSRPIVRDSAAKLAVVERALVDTFIARIPRPWDVSDRYGKHLAI